jgi:hypothetical protein
MISTYLLEYAVLALASIGLLAVVFEIAVKDSSLFQQIATDVRRMAEPTRLPAARRFGSDILPYGASANTNELKKAA